MKTVYFYPGMKYLYGKYCPDYAWIPPRVSMIPPRWDAVKNISASYKYNNKLVKEIL